LGVESNKRVAKIQGSYHNWAELYASLFDVNYQVNTTSQGKQRNCDKQSIKWI